jgi:single-stranded-DNA-specific exonuclease
VRGPAGFRLYTALSRSRDALLGFGGHEAAAGVHIEAGAVDRLRERFAEACIALGAQANPEPPRVVADVTFAYWEDPAKVYRDLERLEPCGHKNPAPYLAFERARVRGVRIMKDAHLALELDLSREGGGSSTLRAFGYDLAAQAPAMGSDVTIVGRLRRDDFRGNGAVEIRIESLRSG